MKNLIVEKRDKIALVTFNRPDVLNACNLETVKELEELLNSLEKDEKIGAVIFKGSEKAFCVGADVREMREFDKLKGEQFSELLQKICQKVENLPKPVIAAIEGYALGFGIEFAMACDIRIASRDAKLGQPEVKLGLIPGAGGTQRLPLLIGKAKAKEIIFTGEMIGAEEAFRLGLINKVVERGKALEEALNLANKIMENSANAVKLAKEVINRSFEAKEFELERDRFGSCFETKDAKEGIAAFLEKRKPKFE